MALIAAACGDSRVDPTATTTSPSTTTLVEDPWIEIEANFMAACRAATEDDDAAALADFCRCGFAEVVEFYGTVVLFSEAEDAIAADPDATDPVLEGAFDGCADLHLN